MTYRVETWFERDRKSVILWDEDDYCVAEWWDEDVTSMVEAGFFDPRDWQGSVVEYATQMGWVK
jgi:hypothetical protein